MAEYNGWTNYETWVTALWINNEQGTQEYALELAREAKTEEEPRYVLSETLKDWVHDSMLPDLGSTLAADLLGASASEINWTEIAESFLSDCETLDE